MNTPQDYRQHLEEILKREEFAETEPGLIENVINSIGDNLNALLSQFGLPLFILVGIAVTLMLVFLLIWLGRKHHLSVNKEAEIKETGKRTQTPQVAFSYSRVSAEEGNYAEALRLLLLSLLLYLNEKGEVDYHYSRTNGEYLRKLRASRFSALYPAEELFNLYENVWYGGKQCLKEDYERGLQLYQRLQEAQR